MTDNETEFEEKLRLQQEALCNAIHNARWEAQNDLPGNPFDPSPFEGRTQQTHFQDELIRLLRETEALYVLAGIMDDWMLSGD